MMACLSSCASPIHSSREEEAEQDSAAAEANCRGTGSFSKVDSEEEEPRRSILEGILTIAFGKYESPAEKKLREMGEWIISQTEGSPSAGKNVLLWMFLWILPTWIGLLLCL